MEFLDFLFISIFVIYIIRVIARMVLPMIFQNVVNKAQQQQTGRQQQNYNSSAKPGKIKVDYIPESSKSKVPDSEGEFVDFEEIK